MLTMLLRSVIVNVPYDYKFYRMLSAPSIFENAVVHAHFISKRTQRGSECAELLRGMGL